MYVCLCKVVTSKTIDELIETGADTTKAIAEACGAGTVCGRCRNNIHTMIKARHATKSERIVDVLRRRVFR